MEKKTQKVYMVAFPSINTKATNVSSFLSVYWLGLSRDMCVAFHWGWQTSIRVRNLTE